MLKSHSAPSSPEEAPFGKVWLEALEAKFGEVSEVREWQCPDKPLIYVFFFDDLPEKGYTTAITCGLSNSNHPEWKHGKPELMVTMESESRRWGLAAGFFASSFFGEKRFSYGDMFSLDHPISDEGDMSAYLVFAPSFLDKQDARFELSDRVIYLTGLYPVYNEEIAIYDRIGLEAFWHADGFEMYNPSRGRVRVA